MTTGDETPNYNNYFCCSAISWYCYC